MSDMTCATCFILIETFSSGRSVILASTSDALEQSAPYLMPFSQKLDISTHFLHRIPANYRALTGVKNGPQISWLRNRVTGRGQSSATATGAAHTERAHKD